MRLFTRNGGIGFSIFFLCIGVFFTSFLPVFSIEPGPENNFTTTTYIFTARIKSISFTAADSTLHLYGSEDFLKRKSGDVFIAGIDAKWAVELEVISVEGRDLVLNEGERIVFVVHSPIKNIGVSHLNAPGKEVGLELVISRNQDGQLGFDLFPSRKKTAVMEE